MSCIIEVMTWISLRGSRGVAKRALKGIPESTLVVHHIDKSGKWTPNTLEKTPEAQQKDSTDKNLGSKAHGSGSCADSDSGKNS